MMKSTFLKKTVLTVAIACAMAGLMAFEAPVRVFAASRPVYASELELVSAKDAADAASQMTSGFVLLETPLYEGKTKTYLTYKPTSNKDEAIVDIKAMHMNGGFSYSLYEDYLKKQEEIATTLVADLQYAIAEMKANLAKTPVPQTALYAKEMLSYFAEDDTGLTLDQLFFAYGKNGLTAAQWNEHLVTMFMQSNTEILAAVERLLLIGCSESTSKSFLDTLDANAKAGVTGVDEEAKPVLATRVADYLNTLGDVQNAILYFEKCQEAFAYTPEMDELYRAQKERALEAQAEDGRSLSDIEADIRKAEANDSETAAALYRFYHAFYNQLTLLQQTYWQNGRLFATELVKYQYPGERFETVYDFIMGIKPTTESEADFNEIYPLLSAMTAGQRGLLKVGVGEELLAVLVDKDTYQSQLDELRGDYIVDDGEYYALLESGDVLPSADDFTVSVYFGVDRSLYTPDGIAMTTAALARSQTNGGDPFGMMPPDPDVKRDKILNTLLIVTGSITGLLVGASVLVILSEVTPMMICCGASFWTCLGAALTGGTLATTAWATPMSVSALGTATLWLTVAALCILAIVVIVKIVLSSNNAVYVPTPRVLCSEEELLPTGKLDAEGNEIKDKGYVYYYGVKNPHLKESGTDMSGGSGVMDVCNWELEGPNREWIALYTTKDTRKGTPIDFSKLKVTESGVETGCATMQNFFSENCDLAEYDRLTHNSDSSIKPKYLHYVITEPDVTGSIFAEGKTWAFGGIGLVLGALGGIGLATLAGKSKKEDPAIA